MSTQAPAATKLKDVRVSFTNERTGETLFSMIVPAENEQHASVLARDLIANVLFSLENVISSRWGAAGYSGWSGLDAPK